MSKFDRILDRIDRKVARAIKASGQKKVYVDYSAYDSDDNDDPIDNLDQVAVPGQVILIRDADEFWGGKKAKDYRSPVLENPTWLQVAVYANEMIKTVRDGHHVFLEGLYKTRKRKGFPEGVTVYEFAMGS